VILDAEKKVHNPQHRVIYRYCDTCSLVFLDIDYNRWKGTYHEVRTIEELDRYTDQLRFEGQKLYDYQYKHFRVHSKDRAVLDVGCGTGGCLDAYKDWDTYGVEPNEDMAEYGKSLGHNIIQGYYPCEIHKKFDLIICYGVLEHCTDLCEVLSGFYDNLKYGGFLHIEVPNLYTSSIHQLGWGHISVFTPSVLRQLLMCQGFEILDFHNKKLFPEYSDSMGFICRKGSGGYIKWEKDSKLKVRVALWLKFHIGKLTVKNIIRKIVEKVLR